MNILYDFDERMRFSQGTDIRGIRAILMDRVPAATGVRKATESEDRQGTDWWVDRTPPLPSLSVDVKVRSQDYSVHPNPAKRADDLALETWSVKPTKVGWTRDSAKRTDYVLWYWADTGRFFLVPFHALCRVFSAKWGDWTSQYKTSTQPNHGWDSECVFVPRAVVTNALDKWQCGNSRSNSTAVTP